MRIMTFNLRFENDRDGTNAWHLRRDLVVALIERFSPSILGTQEGTGSQIDYLHEHLPDYYLHTPHRIFDDTCQYPTLFIRKNDFDILAGAEFWLSETPHVHRSSNWDSAFPRMLSHAKLKSKRSGQSLTAAATHLDHLGTKARLEQTKIISKWVRMQTCPVILMGDFNDSPESPVHRILTARETGLRDTWQILGHEEDAASYTYHGFTGIPRKARMDWILVSSDFRVIDAQGVTDHFNGRYPSDHFPYMAELELV